jgi:hypothetical protein
MKLRPVPPAATWFLKLFCSGPEHDSMIGDLMEQYQRGHHPLWYWRQVIAIVFFGLYRRAERGILAPTNTVPFRQGFALILLAAVLSAVLLSEIWMLFLVGILAGVIIGGLKSWRGDGRTEPTGSDAPGPARIDSSKIPIRGGIGAGILIVILLTGVLLDLPELRLLAGPGILAGLVFAGILRLWRKLHPPAPPLSITRDLQK